MCYLGYHLRGRGALAHMPRRHRITGYGKGLEPVLVRGLWAQLCAVVTVYQKA